MQHLKKAEHLSKLVFFRHQIKPPKTKENKNSWSISRYCITSPDCMCIDRTSGAGSNQHSSWLTQQQLIGQDVLHEKRYHFEHHPEKKNSTVFCIVAVAAKKLDTKGSNAMDLLVCWWPDSWMIYVDQTFKWTAENCALEGNAEGRTFGSFMITLDNSGKGLIIKIRDSKPG